MRHNEEEIWKEYPINLNYENFFRIEISSWGRAKTFHSRAPEGNIVKGSLREGYPCLGGVKLFKKRPPKVASKIQEYNDRVDLMNREIKELLRLKDMPEDVVAQRLITVRAKRDALIQKRKKYIYKTDKERTINFHVLIHRAMAELFLERKEGDEVVIHKDFDKLNNNLDNLAWVTKEVSFARYGDSPAYQAYIKSDKAKNSQKNIVRNFKLTKNDVLYIKEKLSQGKTLKELAHRFGVSDMQIYRIKIGENWSNVKTVAELKEESKKKWQAT